MRIIECMNITLARRIAYYCIAQIIYALTIYYKLINFQIEFDTIKKSRSEMLRLFFIVSNSELIFVQIYALEGNNCKALLYA